MYCKGCWEALCVSTQSLKDGYRIGIEMVWDTLHVQLESPLESSYTVVEHTQNINSFSACCSGIKYRDSLDIF